MQKIEAWSEEKLRSWVYERQSGMQQTRDWKFYPSQSKVIDWMDECGCSQCKRRNPCVWAKVSGICHKTRIRQTAKHKFDYCLRLKNIDSGKVIWIRYFSIYRKVAPTPHRSENNAPVSSA